MEIFNKMWDFFVDWADALGRARAAAELTRQGRHQAARELINGVNG